MSRKISLTDMEYGFNKDFFTRDTAFKESESVWLEILETNGSMKDYMYQIEERVLHD